MSIDASRWAWTQQINPSQKIVLLSLADRADEDGYCYPSIKRLELDCSMTRRTIQRNLAELEAINLIERKSRFTESGQTSNDFFLIGIVDRHAEIKPQRDRIGRRNPIKSTYSSHATSDTPPAPPVTPRTNKQQLVNHQTNNNRALKNLSEAEHAQAMKKLESINQEQAQLLIQAFNATTPLNSPMMLFNGLLKKAKANLLEKAVFTESATQSKYYESEPRATPKREGSQAHHAADLMNAFKNGLESTKHHHTTPTLAQREEMRLEVIKTLLPAKKAEWLREFNEKSFVSCRAISGVILEPDLRAAGLFD